jgi:zinc/manganese transport system substrate-binding protein
MRSAVVAVFLAGAVGLTAAACSTGTSANGTGTAASQTTIVAVSAENEYANVVSQVGGKYVTSDAIMSNPNTDPHTFEASESVAREVSAAQLVIQNGVGYDTFMQTIENAAGNASVKIIDVQKLLGLPDSTPNPHLWYKPTTMPAVANAIAADLAAIQPAHAAYFKANAAAFVKSLDAETTAINAFKARFGSVAVADTEPVADYLLQALGANIETPWTFQADIMNGVDPSPQTVAIEKSLFTGHKVKLFLYNQQVTDPLTESLITLAQQNHIPVVGVYETMPTPGYDYQTWMLAELNAMTKALTTGVSTQHL